jgi:XTP/dITP diphosphohydrolase
MELIFASGNPHKLGEMRALLPAHAVLSPSEVGCTFIHDEVADTFSGNALGKALALFDIVRRPVFADDSGLVVDALGGRPGIHTARFGSSEFGRTPNAKEQYEYLLRLLAEVPPHERTARFVCSIALVLSPYRQYIIQETVEGRIALEPSGIHGFGYDPIFIAQGTDCTLAQLSEDDKHRISHRGRAVRSMLALLEHLELHH